MSPRNIAVPKIAATLLALALPALSLAGSAKKIDFSRLVVVGDSLAAGVENGSLVDFQQEHGFAAVIARQIRARLTLPLVPYPGAPNTLELVNPAFPPTIKPVPGQLVFPRLNPFERVTNLAVPLQTLDDALNRKPDKNLTTTTDTTQAATDLVLGFPCPVLFPCPSHSPALSQIQQAVELKPSAVIIDIGNNDILGAITSGQFGSLATNPAAVTAFLTTFGAKYQAMLTALAGTRATLIVANIPDVIQSAYFIPVAKLAAAVGQPPAAIAAILGIGVDDYLTLDAIPTVEAILTNAVAGPLPATCPATSATPCVVTALQAAGIRQITRQLNIIIQTEVAAVPKSVFVDVFSLVDTLATKGYKICGTTLSTDFLGGLFSLDGLHPSNTGYAIFANEFLKDINGATGSHYPLANVQWIADFDPLVLTK